MDETGEVDIPNTQFLIQQEGDVFKITSPNVEIDSEKGEKLDFLVTLEKLPTDVSEGKKIAEVIIDKSHPTVQKLLQEARLLRDVPEEQRPRRLLQLLREYVTYAYTRNVDALRKTNPELAEWVRQNVGEDSSDASVKLSDIIRSGYGVCRHLSVLMLVMAEEAGMQGAYLTCGGNSIKNVARRDDGKPLFKSEKYKMGEPVSSAHAWVELKTSDGRWIPVDPSTQLVGDSEEGMETFRDAHYRALPGVALDFTDDSEKLSLSVGEDLWFMPGESSRTGTVGVYIISEDKLIENSFPLQWRKVHRKHKGPMSARLFLVEEKESMKVAIRAVKKL